MPARSCAKYLRPELRPLLVNVVGTALKWYRSGEQDNRGKTSQRLHEPLGTVMRQVLSNLKRQRNVERPANVQWLTDIHCAELIGSDLDRASVNISPVNAHDIGHPMFHENP